MIVSDLLVKNSLERPSPDMIFRQVKINGESVIIPASNAIGIVLRHNLTKEPSIEELTKIVADI